MKGWYVPKLNTYYQADIPSEPDHVEVPFRPGNGWEWDDRSNEWILPEWRRELDESRAALAALAATDWRVIRAMEDWLYEHNELDVELRNERQALRDSVKGESRD